MKYFKYGFTAVLALISCTRTRTKPDSVLQTNQSIFDIPVISIDGKQTSLREYQGKKILIVNVASKCGYTPQYEKLEELSKQYGDKITVLGFPSNNFLSQEPGTDSEIIEFCKKNYGVTFPLFSKTNVKGAERSPLYKWLSEKELNGWNRQEPSWNFCKYLISENGELLKFFPSSIDPMGPEILSAIK